MFDNNICNFVPKSSLKQSNEDVSILTFVYEMNPNDLYKKYLIRSCYTLNIVISGEGEYQTLYKSYPLKENDFFITFPSTNFKIISKNNDLKYIYISLIGNGIVDYLEKIKVSKNKPVFRLKNRNLLNFYVDNLNKLNNENFVPLSLSTYYYTMAELTQEGTENQKESQITKQIRHYIDQNYNDPNLKLDMLADSLNYNPNYISGIFKKEFGVNFTTYLLNTRLSAAISLINNGITSIKEVSTLCGFNDSLYFSKVFKKAYGLPPTSVVKNKIKLYDIAK